MASTATASATQTWLKRGSEAWRESEKPPMFLHQSGPAPPGGAWAAAAAKAQSSPRMSPLVLVPITVPPTLISTVPPLISRSLPTFLPCVITTVPGEKDRGLTPRKAESRSFGDTPVKTAHSFSSSAKGTSVSLWIQPPLPTCPVGGRGATGAFGGLLRWRVKCWVSPLWWPWELLSSSDPLAERPRADDASLCFGFALPPEGLSGKAPSKETCFWIGAELNVVEVTDAGDRERLNPRSSHQRLVPVDGVGEEPREEVREDAREDVAEPER
mmetsp:Transcript_11211/g.29132  ORF Transcript_11211/g.29132 Transcript_11211/m.29132 type:complete len:271 (-) Transcript_11211:393-1205(-)